MSVYLSVCLPVCLIYWEISESRLKDCLDCLLRRLKAADFFLLSMIEIILPNSIPLSLFASLCRAFHQIFLFLLFYHFFLSSQEENYIAASTVYSTFDLGSEKYLNLNLVRITDEALHAQRTREALTHLCLPEVVAQRGVILVNSMSTLREAADILGFPLQNSSSITASSASGRKSAKSLRKKNLSEFTGSSSSGNSSSSYSGNSNRSGNKSSNNISNNNNSSSSSGSGSNDKTSPLTRQPSLSGPSVRLYVGVDAEWKASMINSKSCPTAEPGAALLQVRYLEILLQAALYLFGCMHLCLSICLSFCLSVY